MIKRYLAEDMAGAMEKVRLELGRDAYLVSTRKIRRKGHFRHPLVEVVASYEPPPETSNMAALAYAGNESEKILKLESKLDDISAALGTLVGKMHTEPGDVRGNFPPAVDNHLRSLVENEVHSEFAARIAREVGEITARDGGADPADVIEHVIRQRLGEPSPIRLRKYKHTTAVFLGPTGVGKTTTVAKLAAIYAHRHHARVGVITTDTTRLAAVEQLKTYTEILGVPISVVYTEDDMADALEQHAGCDVVFIDTAGKSPRDKTLQPEVSALLRDTGADEVHLVVSATTSFTGCMDIIGAYSFLKDFKLLFTKLDESGSWGALLNLRFLSDRPISFVTTGQNVPDDLEVMDPGKIAKRLMALN